MIKEISKTLIIVLILIVCNTTSVFAGSGCCSWHGGVDNGAGPDGDGSVICNDGWRDSSCMYSGGSKSTNSDNNSSNNNTNNNSLNNGRKSITIKDNSEDETTSAEPSNNNWLLIVLGVGGYFFVLYLIEKINDKNQSNVNQSIKSEENEDNNPNVVHISKEETKIFKCPKCGSLLVKRHGKYGNFYGCINYPRCDGKKTYKKISKELETLKAKETRLSKEDLSKNTNNTKAENNSDRQPAIIKKSISIRNNKTKLDENDESDVKKLITELWNEKLDEGLSSYSVISAADAFLENNYSSCKNYNEELKKMLYTNLHNSKLISKNELDAHITTINNKKEQIGE